MPYHRLFCIVFLCMTLLMGRAQNLTKIQTDEKWGFMKTDSTIAVPCIYDEVYPFVDNIAIVRKDTLWGFVDTKGTEKDIRYTQISTFGNNGMYKALYNKKWTLLDLHGNPLPNSQQYDIILPVHKGVAIVVNDKKRGLVDGVGNIILRPQYEALECGEYIIFSKQSDKPGSSIGMCDYQGRMILPEGILMSGYPPSDDIILGKVWNKDGKGTSFAFYNINTKQTTILPSPFGIVYNEFKNGYCLVKESGNRSYFIDKTGKKVSPDYEMVGARSEGHYVVKLNGKYGVIDSLIHETIPCKYDEGGTYISEGLWNTMSDDEWGYLNMMGQQAIPFEYEFTQPFFKGHAYVGELIDGDVRFGLINRNGNMVLPIKWKNIKYTLNNKGEMNAVWLTADSVYCRLDTKTMKYSYQQSGFNDVEFDNQGNTLVRQGEFWGCVDTDGNQCIPARIPTKEMIISILDKMQKEGKKQLDYTETYRNSIYANEKRNYWNLRSQIPENMWDY